MQRIGDILVADGILARDVLESHATRARGLLGDYLRTHGAIGGRDLARALARQRGLPFVNFDSAPPDRSLFSPREMLDYIRRRYVPYKRAGRLLMIATPQPSEQLASKIRQRTGCEVEMVVVSNRDLNGYLARAGATSLTRRARVTLRRRHRNLVASRVMVPQQIYGFLGLSVLMIAALFAAPSFSWQALLILCNLFYLATLAFKFELYLEGMRSQGTQRLLQQAIDADVAALRDADLPIYTILVPLYHEPRNVLAQLMVNLSALDYPKEKLDIKLICEADDLETIDTLKTLHPPETMEILRVPPSAPRTKPKACNVAMHQVRGDYLVIFDAEDAPEPKQLKRALAYFQRDDKTVACLQAPLNYYNRSENLLTQMFAIEYSALFKLLLPALERMELPIPLGGTSNHLKVATLHAMGGWDAFNVTEDADLGVRLAYLGRKTRVLPSLTLEEAPITLMAWLKQRTRWVKGYIQTWLVYMRDPAELKRQLGQRGYYGFQFFIGAPALTFLFAPFFWAVFLLACFGLVPVTVPDTLIHLCLISFIGGVLSHWLFARAVLLLEGWKGMGVAMAVFPFYWLLHSVACVRALWQLATAPHYWEKTSHGVSRVFISQPRGEESLTRALFGT